MNFSEQGSDPSSSVPLDFDTPQNRPLPDNLWPSPYSTESSSFDSLNLARMNTLAQDPEKLDGDAVQVSTQARLDADTSTVSEDRKQTSLEHTHEQSEAVLDHELAQDEEIVSRLLSFLLPPVHLLSLRETEAAIRPPTTWSLSSRLTFVSILLPILHRPFTRRCFDTQPGPRHDTSSFPSLRVWSSPVRPLHAKAPAAGADNSRMP